MGNSNHPRYEEECCIKVKYSKVAGEMWVILSRSSMPNLSKLSLIQNDPKSFIVVFIVVEKSSFNNSMDMNTISKFPLY